MCNTHTHTHMNTYIYVGTCTMCSVKPMHMCAYLCKTQSSLESKYETVIYTNIHAYAYIYTHKLCSNFTLYNEVNNIVLYISVYLTLLWAIIHSHAPSLQKRALKKAKTGKNIFNIKIVWTSLFGLISQHVTLGFPGVWSVLQTQNIWTTSKEELSFTSLTSFFFPSLFSFLILEWYLLSL